MRGLSVVGVVCALPFMALAFVIAVPAKAQSLPPAPQPVPSAPTGPFGGIAVENYQVTSSSNEHGSYLWIVAPAQHVVILCEKPQTVKDFSCFTKRLP
jgi:hypothetical protein